MTQISSDHHRRPAGRSKIDRQEKAIERKEQKSVKEKGILFAQEVGGLQPLNTDQLAKRGLGATDF